MTRQIAMLRTEYGWDAFVIFELAHYPFDFILGRECDYGRPLWTKHGSGESCGICPLLLRPSTFHPWARGWYGRVYYGRNLSVSFSYLTRPLPLRPNSLSLGKSVMVEFIVDETFLGRVCHVELAHYPYTFHQHFIRGRERDYGRVHYAWNMPGASLSCWLAHSGIKVQISDTKNRLCHVFTQMSSAHHTDTMFHGNLTNLTV